MDKLVKGHPVGETPHADPDALEDPVAGELVEHQAGLHLARLLVGVGDDAADKVGLGGVQGAHQGVQLRVVKGGDGLAAAPLFLLALLVVRVLLPALARVFPEDVDGQGVGARLEQLHDGVVERVLVLFQPVGQVVGHGAGVVDDGKVGVLVRLGDGLGEVGRLAEVVGLELLLERLVRGLGKEGLLLEDGQDAQGLLEHGDAGLQVHAEVDHLPLDALLEVLLLLQDEHVVVEELLQLLVAKVDAELLETVELETKKRKEDVGFMSLVGSWRWWL